MFDLTTYPKKQEIPQLKTVFSTLDTLCNPLYNMVKKQNVAQQRLGLQNYLPKASLCPGGRDSSLQELLLGVEQNVLVASDDGGPLPAQPGDRA